MKKKNFAYKSPIKCSLIFSMCSNLAAIIMRSYLCLLLTLAAAISAHELMSEPTFHVLTPNELVIELPYNDHQDLHLITFRMGVKRQNNDFEDLEKGENVVRNNNVFIKDQRLRLAKGDALNYLLAYRDNEEYKAKTGTFVFDGVYTKFRVRRDAERHERQLRRIPVIGEFLENAHAELHRQHVIPNLHGIFNPFRSQHNHYNYNNNDYHRNPYHQNPYYHDSYNHDHQGNHFHDENCHNDNNITPYPAPVNEYTTISQLPKTFTTVSPTTDWVDEYLSRSTTDPPRSKSDPNIDIRFGKQ